MAPIKVMIFGTHPKQFNGYSKVVYELCKELALKHEDVAVSIFGFQNMFANTAHRLDLPANIDVYDALANENPKTTGFGINQVVDVVSLKRPDVVVIYNDALVILQILNQLRNIKDKWFKTVLYIDQVYLNQKKEFIEFMNQNADAAFAFTPSWRDCIVEQGLTIPCEVLEHGINPDVYYPVPKKVARKYFNLSEDDFIVINLNRNQPRKRWDTCIKAFAQVVANQRDRAPDKPMIKFIIGTALKGSWDLIELYERELKKRGMTLQEGIKHLIIIDNPQKLTDQEINVLYNVSDCGINTADGEGVGLCSVEAAVIGIPQIVPRLGGFVDFFDDDCAMMVEPTMAYYVDNTRDMVGGEALLCDFSDFVNAIETYYDDANLRARHGEAARKKILKPHLWSTIAAHFVDVIKKIHAGTCAGTISDSGTSESSEKSPAPPAHPPVVDEGIDDIIIADIAHDDNVIEKGGSNEKKKKKKKKKKMSKKKGNMEVEQLLQMRMQLDALLAKLEQKNA